MNRIELNGGRDYLEWREAPGNVVEIVDIAVGTDRRKGLGRAMVTDLIETRVPETTHLVYAIARADNEIAAQFYEALGFQRMAVLFSFYPEGHAVIYGRKL